MNGDPITSFFVRRNLFWWKAVVVTKFPDGSSITKESDWHFLKRIAELERRYLVWDAELWYLVLKPYVGKEKA